MMNEMNWGAPIEAGRSMLGLTLGLSAETLDEILRKSTVRGDHTISFMNSPYILFERSKDGNVLLRAADKAGDVYEWQNLLGRLVLSGGVLSSIVVDAQLADEAYQYRGKLFGKIGLGSRVSDLLEFCRLDYDDVEEVFRPVGGLSGLEIGGSTACDLSDNPDQVVTFIRVY